MIININEDRKWQQQGGAEGWKLEQTDAPIQAMWRGLGHGRPGHGAAAAAAAALQSSKFFIEGLKRGAKTGDYSSLLRQSKPHKRLAEDTGVLFGTIPPTRLLLPTAPICSA